MSRVRASMATTFSSLRVRNFRLFFIGQLVSVSGTWMQLVALSWLVLDLSDDSAVAVGVITALQQLPMLLFGVWGGVLADRFDKRRILIITQGIQAVAALGLAAVDLSGAANLWNVGVLVTLGGFAIVADGPVRLAFASEMVGRESVANAVALNSAAFNAARMVGPAIAGAIILTADTGWCFLVNAASYLVVIGCLVAMRPGELLRSPRVARAKGQVREGLRYIWATPGLRSTLILMTVIGTLALNFPVVLPVLAKVTFDSDAGGASAMLIAIGLGAVAGGLVAANRGRASERMLLWATAAFGTGLLVASVAPTLPVLVVVLVPVGMMNMTVYATSNALVQLEAAPHMRGRVLAVRAITVLGLTPIGAPIAGWICEHLGPRWGLASGGLTTLAAAVWYRTHLQNQALVFDQADATVAPMEPTDTALA